MDPDVHYHIHKCPPLSPSWASSVQSILPLPTSWRSTLILSSHLRLGLPNGLFPPGFPTKTLYTTLPSTIRATRPIQLILLDFITRSNEAYLFIFMRDFVVLRYGRAWVEGVREQDSEEDIRMIWSQYTYTRNISYRFWYFADRAS